ncbi:DUF1697 domain-containing protein [Pseudodonghicola xiamenensis]|uniref:DUF1697 domain-containing protein n=1 Tax=Pseudodonghicola xiamenensis TaxID=337702 RepID=A0A8J3H6M9_9RHOB|nr:DUF1697 domain-containing protein [Pseudodonghicola xiamenensis]GHG85258.1 hypothetical protein GCM10010961_12190 [Pseudodonghicola xiamenensis]
MMSLIALLRAVNVGGTGRLPMAELREVCRSAGFSNVRTYVQSGNVVFETDNSPAVARAALEAGLLDHCGKPVSVILRDGAAMRSLLARNPFPEAAPDKVAVLFLESEAPPDLIDRARGRASEDIVPAGCDVFIHYPDGMGRSRLRLPVMAEGTVRNLRTVAKLAELSMGQS